ncbi:WD40/YVTN/BNR-like repeat-containing protein [Paenibacillus ginsengarvi]|nr:hypothetical protein [Paenibacillus ginsengarvi]
MTKKVIGILLLAVVIYFGYNYAVDASTPYYTIKGSNKMNGTTAQIGPSGDPKYKKIVYINDQYIAVTLTGFIYQSIDGQTWKEVYRDTGRNSLYDVVYGNGYYLAIGNIVVKSFDGEHWAPKDNNLTNSLTEVAFGNGVFVGNNSQRILTSVDGAMWGSKESAWHLYLFRDIAFGDGKFVAIASFGIYHWSKDGYEWSEAKVDKQLDGHSIGKALKSISYGNGIFVCVSDDPDRDGGSMIYLSKDGVKWKRAARFSGTPERVEVSPEGLIAVIGKKLILVSRDGSKWASYRTEGEYYVDVAIVKDRMLFMKATGEIVEHLLHE